MGARAVTWFTLEDDRYFSITEEINKQRDRGAAIIAVAVLEDHLLAAIKAKLSNNDAKIEDKMFNGYGPLASFSARIDLGFLLGLYESEIHKALHQIRKIRNEFAHNLSPLSFRSPHIRAICAQFEPPKGSSRRFHKMLDKTLDEAKFSGDKRIHVRFPFARRSTNPRTQYLRMVQRITMVIAFGQLTEHKKRGATAS